MEQLLNEIILFCSWVAENGETITVSALAIIGWADKMALVLLKTLKNIRDSWRDFRNDRNRTSD